MEYVCGNLYIRQPNEGFLTKDQVVLGHRHNFHHMTMITHGSFEICLLEATEVNAEGAPLNAQVLEQFVVRADDEINWVLILKGKFHTLRALEDHSRYQCVYAHQMPQALSVGEPGQTKEPPITKRDENGVLWVRVNEKIVQDSAEWAAAYA